MLQQGDKAPDFTLTDGAGDTVSLADYKGRKVVLYFYPKNNTPGCTKQACAFRDAYSELKAMGVEVLGISKDSVKSHEKFAEKNNLKFRLLSDESLEAIQAYGVWQEKKNYGKTYMGIVRTTFVINEEGIIEKVFEKVKADKNAQQVLDWLQENR